MTSTIDATHLDELPILKQLPVEHLADVSVELEPPQLITTPVGNRMVFIAKGGRIEGLRISGEVLPGGGDWLLAGSDGFGRVDVRATINTDDGALISYTAGGLIKIPADGLARLAAGQRLSFGETYVRTTPKFETADERYDWLSKVVAIGYNLLSPNHVDYRIYQVL
jgi:Protein of unknown function (DUF3237)